MSTIADCQKTDVLPDTRVTFLGTVMKIGEVVSNPNSPTGTTFFKVWVADTTAQTCIRIYNKPLHNVIKQEKTYRFTNILKKWGNEEFWVVKETEVCRSKDIAIPAHLSTVTENPGSADNQQRTLQQALQSPTSSSVTGRIINVSYQFISFNTSEQELPRSETICVERPSED